jgi:hypothetical protein
MAQACTLQATTTTKQKRKFEHLHGIQHPVDQTDANKVVINLSNKDLEPAAVSILSKGLNYAQTTSIKSKMKDFISGIEQAIHHLPTETAEEIRQEASRIIRLAKPQRTNTSKAEREALRTLRNDDSVTILPADKGNATVILSSTVYKSKVRSLLDDHMYKKLLCDPTSKIEKETASLIKGSDLPEETKKKLIPHTSIPSRLYRLPKKIHKEGVPLRPVVNCIASPTYSIARYLTGLLNPLVGYSPSHIRNSEDFTHKLNTISLKESDILVSFDVVSLFTRVPLEDTLLLLQQHFHDKTISLFKQVLTTTYFTYNGAFYDQTDGVAMGSPLAPVIANYYMEHFEQQAISKAPRKPTHWYRYVDDTYMVWPHGEEELREFLDHVNSIHHNIKFTMEVEKNRSLLFLDVLVSRRPDGSLGHTVYRKPTHTDLYLHAKSAHHPAQKTGVLYSLIHRARRLSDADSLDKEIQHLKETFIKNGYSNQDIRRALQKKDEPRPKQEKPVAVARLPYQRAASHKVSRLLAKFNIQTVHIPAKNFHLLRPAKDKLGLRTAGIYGISCECGKVYVGQTGRTIEARLKEHRRHVRLNQPERSAVAEHSSTTYHRIDFDGASKLGTATRYMGRLVREAIEIRLHPDNFNRDDGFNLSHAWRLIIKMLQLPNSAPMANQEQAQVENQLRPPGHRRGLYK